MLLSDEQRIHTLRRRAVWLKGRIAQAASIGRDLDKDVQEEQSILWALAEIESLKAVEMREALELIAAPMRADGTWNRDREACRELAAEALGRYDDDTRRRPTF